MEYSQILLDPLSFLPFLRDVPSVPLCPLCPRNLSFFSFPLLAIVRPFPHYRIWLSSIFSSILLPRILCSHREIRNLSFNFFQLSKRVFLPTNRLNIIERATLRVNAYRNVNRCLRILGQITPMNLRYNIFSKYNFRLYWNVDNVLVMAKATCFLSYKTFPKHKSILPLYLFSSRMITSPLSIRPCFFRFVCTGFCL